MLTTLHNKALMKRRGAEQGFTLIELLVVIVIIGILAAIAIPAFLNQRQTARDASVTSDVRNAATEIQTAMANYPDATYFIVTNTAPTPGTNGPLMQTPPPFTEGTNGKVVFLIGNSRSDYTTVTANLSSGNRIAIRDGYDAAGNNIPGEYLISVCNPSGKAFDCFWLADVNKRRAQVWDSVRGGLQK